MSSKTQQINVRLTEKDIKALDKAMKSEGIDARSQYIRMLIRKHCK